VTALDLSRAPSLAPELWLPDAPELWRPSREIVRTAGGYTPGPVQHRRAASSGPTPPTPPAGALLAIDGLDLSTLYQDRPAPGTTPVTTDGQYIGTARDVSGSSNHLAAPLDAARYTYNAGSNQRLRAANSVLIGPQLTCSAWTVGICWRMRTALAVSGAASLLVVRTATTPAPLWLELILTRISGYQQLSFAGGITTGGITSVGWGGSAGTSLGTTSHWAVISCTGTSLSSPGSYTLTIDGEEQLSDGGSPTLVASGTLASPGASATTSLGSRWDGSTGSVQSAVDIGRLRVYGSQLDSTGRAQLGAWCAVAL
jgi:hypothetical protein